MDKARCLLDVGSLRNLRQPGLWCLILALEYQKYFLAHTYVLVAYMITAELLSSRIHARVLDFSILQLYHFGLGT